MEELRTTEVLDREILEDARKKALKILKTAEDTLASQKQEWENKTQKAVDSIRNVYAGRIKKTGDEILARLPLDKRRLRTESAEGLLVKSMDDFLRSLGRETLLAAVEREVYDRLADCGGERAAVKETPPEVTYSGLSLAETRGILEKVLAALSKKTSGFSAGFAGGNAADWNYKEDTRAREFPSISIDTRAMKITASVENTANALLKDKRAELAAALLGEGVLND